MPPGAFVEVPLGPRKVIGVVWGPGEGGFVTSKLRAVSRVLDAAPMSGAMRAFLIRAAEYTLTPLPAMLRLASRAPGLADPPGPRRVYRGGGPAPGGAGGRMTEARARVLAVVAEYGGAAFTLSELAGLAGVSARGGQGVGGAGGADRGGGRPRCCPTRGWIPARSGRDLAPDQAVAAAELVPGGGGRALWHDASERRHRVGQDRGLSRGGGEPVCAQGRQALVMLPEIALTAEFLTRVEARFGARPGEWHSGVTQTERRRLWRMAGEGGVGLVVGARSALFLPFRDLGLIVVDEEHDGSYKQEDGVHYNARDMAVLRASLCDAQVVLASATPCLETWVNARAGKYARIDLTSRFGVAEMPRMGAVDMRGEGLAPGRWIGPTLAAAVAARLGRGEQALLFLNRRGYAPVTICRACGEQIGCDHCDARLVEHRFLKRLVCHQCGETRPMPEACPSCGVVGRLAAVGPGVERLAEEVAERFPQARVAVLSSDLFASARALKAAIGAIAGGGADLIIGTQLVAKGHNFPHLTLVGVIDADLGLQGSDLRAAERTFQLIRQVSGRAGRGERAGEALLQTFQPGHPVIRAILSGEEEAFWRAEAAEREAAGMPPFGRLAGIVLSSPDERAVYDFGAELARRDAPLRRIGAQVFGPAPAPVARVRGRHRVRLLVKSARGAARGAVLQPALAEWVGQLKPPANLRLVIDIDPQSFY